MKNVFKLFVKECKDNWRLTAIGIGLLLIEICSKKYFHYNLLMIKYVADLLLFIFPVILAAKIFSRQKESKTENSEVVIAAGRSEKWVSKYIYGIIQVVLIWGLFFEINVPKNQVLFIYTSFLYSSGAIVAFTNTVLIAVIFRRYFISLFTGILCLVFYAVILSVVLGPWFTEMTGIQNMFRAYSYYRYITEAELIGFYRLIFENVAIIAAIAVVLLGYASLLIFRAQKEQKNSGKNEKWEKFKEKAHKIGVLRMFLKEWAHNKWILLSVAALFVVEAIFYTNTGNMDYLEKNRIETMFSLLFMFFPVLKDKVICGRKYVRIKRLFSFFTG